MSGPREKANSLPSKGKAVISAELCKGCQLCVVVCPHQSIFIAKDCNSAGKHYAVFEQNKFCSACKFCAISCPDSAIQIYKFERD